jgi:hypothetical protein
VRRTPPNSATNSICQSMARTEESKYNGDAVDCR